MCLEPKNPSRGGRINTDLGPPSCLVATAMDFAMVPSTKRNGELIADLAAKRS
jgi:hypothetical protein